MPNRFDNLAAAVCRCANPVEWTITGETVTVCGLCGQTIKGGQ